MLLNINARRKLLVRRLYPTPLRPLPLYSPNRREGTFSEIGGSKPLDQHTTYSEQSRVTLGSCCLLPGHSHTCCEDLLQRATGCCSRVARELLLCSALRTARSIGYTGLSSQGAGLPFLCLLGN